MDPHSSPFLDHGLASTTLHPLGLKVQRADGPWLHLEGGGKLFDAISGIGVSSFGHGHPDILGALKTQMDQHLHAMVYGELMQEVQIDASQALRATLPDHLDAIYFLNSGAEAMEAAMKLAKRVTGRQRLFGVEGGYHGSTHGALSISSNEGRKSAYRPLLPDIDFLPWNEEQDLERVDATVAAVVVETVQGDAGIRVPKASWLLALQKKCQEVGALLILDEIQCGMGRTGKPWAFAHFGLQPDIVCMGKALGGGMPIGALAASKSHMKAFAHSPALGHITTFGGHPLACAGALGALQVMEQLDWSQLEKRWCGWERALSAHPAVHHMRRLGGFMALELGHADNVERAVKAGIHHAQTEGEGAMLFWFLSVPTAFRLAPPLVGSDEDMERGLSLVLRCLDEVAG